MHKADGEKPLGWYLAFQYCKGPGLYTERCERIPEGAAKGQNWIFVDDSLLAAANWRDCLADYQREVATVALWVADCRATNLPGQRVTMGDLVESLERPGWECIEADLIDGHAFIVVRRLKDKAAPFAVEPWRKPEKAMLVMRGGALGDGIMASTVFPGLKEKGHHITVACNEAIHHVLQHDPHIDSFIVHGEGQVSKENAGRYFAALARRFDKSILLSYVVEEDGLKRPWDGSFWWSDEQRRRLCGGSYLLRHHHAADVPLPFRPAFYPTPEEEASARAVRDKIGPFILWSLRGSGHHKWWPYTPQAVVQILAHTDLAVVLAGDQHALDLEGKCLQAAADYYGSSARVFSMVNTGDVRRVLTVARLAELVIGPETAVLNSVSMMDVPKIVLLSHSAHSNLSADWREATAIVPKTPCYPCHRLHYNFDHCFEDKATGAAACQASTKVDELVAHIRRRLEERRASPHLEA